MRRASATRLVVESAIALTVAALVALFAHFAKLNLITVALTFHVGVVAVAAWRGPLAGTVAALASAAGLSFLLHPVGSWRIADPASWIAFASFLIAATITSRVVVKSRQAARAAEERSEELAQLYRIGDGLRRSEELKTNLLRAVSHDLNTPLTSIRIDVAAIRRIADGDARVAPVVERLERDVNRLHRRIENLLALARLEAGTLVPHRDPTPPADLFRAVEEHLSFIARERPLAISVERDCADLDVDPSLALEVVVNLVENAHRASPAGEPVEIVASAKDSRTVAIEVRDRGTGFGAAGPDSVDLTDLPRRGLGLQIALAFTAALGGTLSLRDRDGGGAVAAIDLPAAAVAAEER